MIPDHIQTEHSACPNGCQPGEDLLFVGRDRLQDLPGNYAVQKCRSCGLIRTDPRPVPASIGYYYPDDYGPYLSSTAPQGAPVQRSWLRRAIRAASQSIVRMNTEALPNMPPGRMLEVGCASGAFMAQMSNKGWQVEGIEFSESAANKACSLGLQVQTGAIEAAAAPAERPDLIVGWMVVEHLHDPVGALRKLASWAAPGAWLAISTPNAGSLDFRLFRSANYALHLPNHLYHFDPRTLTTVLDKAGWKVDRVLHQRVLGNYLGSIGLLLEDWGAPRKLAHFFRDLPARRGYLNHWLYPIAWPLSLLGQTGRMTVWARLKEQDDAA